MFNTKSRITSTSYPMFDKGTRIFSWRKLAVALLLGGIGLLFWSRYKLMQLSELAAPENYMDTNLTVKKANGGKFGARKPIKPSLESKVVTDYCQIKECPTVYCSSISQESDPGRVAAMFIENTLKVYCKNAESVKLVFDKCKFPESKLRRSWLPTNVSIDELTLDSCSLSEIEGDIFSPPIFRQTKKITITNNNPVSLHKATFQHLTMLQELSIRENAIKQAEFNLLEHVSNTLTTVELNNAIDNPDVLRNITGTSRFLRVKILSLRGNIIPIMDREMFKGLSAVQSLYIENSNVKSVSLGALDSMSSSIIQLHMNGNDIISLPKGFFDNILRSRRSFRMAIHENPWRCNCSLKWLQNLQESMRDIFIRIPVCRTPEINAFKPFNEAKFCNDSTSNMSDTSAGSNVETTKREWSQVTSQTEGTTENSSNNSVNLTCRAVETILLARGSRKLLSIDYQLPSRYPNFSVSRTMDEGILINLPNFDERATLLWFDSDHVEKSLGCAKNVKHSYLLQHIDPQTSYTICLLVDNSSTVSPLNCLSVTTSPAYGFRTWLTNADKSVALLVLILSLILLFLLAAFVTCMLIRRHPSLLRGSKRLMFVKRTNVDAIVLPKGVHIDEKKETDGPCGKSCKHEDGYVTPLPPAGTLATRRSRMSLQSDWNSYVSELEPTETQLYAWRPKSLSPKRKSVAPPLPPHPPANTVPSLSLATRSKEERTEYLASTV